MGYEVHIVRRVDWVDLEEESNISLNEWLSYVGSDSELELTNGYQIKVPGMEFPFQKASGFCNWIKHSTKVGDDKPWFHYGHGMISAKYPDAETIGKMIAIAKCLNGKVQGDDGEFYEDGDLHENASRHLVSIGKPAGNKPWWKFW